MTKRTSATTPTTPARRGTKALPVPRIMVDLGAHPNLCEPGIPPEHLIELRGRWEAVVRDERESMARKREAVAHLRAIHEALAFRFMQTYAAVHEPLVVPLRKVLWLDGDQDLDQLP